MNPAKHSRRSFLKTSAAAMAAGVDDSLRLHRRCGERAKPRSKNDRLRIGADRHALPGVGRSPRRRWRTATSWPSATSIAQIAEKAREEFGGKADLYEDYRKMLERKDIDVVTIGTPDHWHTKMVIDACRAGKDVYCEKPLTLTDRRRQAARARWSRRPAASCRSAPGSAATTASAWPANWSAQGRIGKLRKVDVVLGKNKTGRTVPGRDRRRHI